MKQRLGVIVGVLAAFLVGSFAMSGAASASGDAVASNAKLTNQIKKANKKAKVACKKVKKAKGKKAKAKAKKRCNVAKRNAKKARAKLKSYNAQFFDVCKHGCKYRTIQAGVSAAGKWKNKNKKRNATVRVQPGTYNEGVLVHGKLSGHDFKNLTIMGVTKAKKPNPDARAVILEGEGALTVEKGNHPLWRDGDPASVPAQNAIWGISTVGLTMKNMWARHYQNNTFFVVASNVKDDQEYCADYVMDNLVSSDTRAYGLFARNCFGGKILNSEGWGHGDSTVYIGETPCDTYEWTNKGDNPQPCQKNPKWTLVKNIKAWGNPLGYSGTNSKYVKITDSKWFNNGAGLVPNTLDSEKFEPTGDLIIENNDIFWNNYNYYQPDSGYFNVIGNGNPIGVGIMLYGSDGVIARNNNIFGHEKWGATSFSGPELFGVNKGDDARNMNNQFINNKMGLNGVDPNAIDFFNDGSGGGNCWQGNTAAGQVTFAPGNGSQELADIYPSCPQDKVIWKNVTSLNLGAGLQVNLAYLDPQEPWRDLSTIFGYATIVPPKDSGSGNECDGEGYYSPLCDLPLRPNISRLMECDMKVVDHPDYTVGGETFKSKSAPRVTEEECAQLAAL